MKTYLYRVPNVRAEQWWPHQDPRHIHLDGVDKGPRADQGYGLVVDWLWHTLRPGDWVLWADGAPIRVLPDHEFHALFVEEPPMPARTNDHTTTPTGDPHGPR